MGPGVGHVRFVLVVHLPRQQPLARSQVVALVWTMLHVPSAVTASALHLWKRPLQSECCSSSSTVLPIRERCGLSPSIYDEVEEEGGELTLLTACCVQSTQATSRDIT